MSRSTWIAEIKGILGVSMEKKRQEQGNKKILYVEIDAYEIVSNYVEAESHSLYFFLFFCLSQSTDAKVFTDFEMN